MSLGDRLKSERVRLGHSQAAFGEIGGVKRAAQAKYERGETFPDTNYLGKIDKVGADIYYILTGQQLNSDGVNIYNEVGDALLAVVDVQKELGLTFDAEQIKSVIGFAWTAQASREQIIAFVRGAYAFVGQDLPAPPKSE